MGQTKNQFCIRGRVGKIQGGRSENATVSLATDRKWKDKNGDEHKETDWHYVTVWGQQATFVLDGADRIVGQLVEACGRISYAEKDGKKFTNLNATDFDVLTWPKREDGDSGGSRTRRSAQPATNTPNTWEDEDIPF